MTRIELCEVARQLGARARPLDGSGPLPTREAVADLVRLAPPLLFPHHLLDAEGSTDSQLERLLEEFGSRLGDLLKRSLACLPHCDREAQENCTVSALGAQVIARLPALQDILGDDLDAAMDGDPALVHVAEAVLCYPGLAAVMCYRLAHELHGLGVPVVPRMIAAHAYSTTGIDIHPGARIGRRFFIDHGSGVVIGGTAVIGDNVRLYQGVTLGARSFPVDGDGRVLKGRPRHPVVEDDVVIYSGATLLGRITIGRGATIGGNVWVTHDVAPGTRVTQAQTRRDGFRDGDGI